MRVGRHPEANWAYEHSAHRFEEVHDRLDRMEATMARLVSALESSNLTSTPPPAFNSRTIISSSHTQSQCSPGTPQTPQLNNGGPLATTYKIPVRREVQYLGPSSLMMLSSEAGSLAEEQLRLSSPGSEVGGSHRRRGASDPMRVSADGNIGASVESMLSQPAQAETVGALRGLSAISTNVAAWFPHYGHRELRMGAGSANMGIPRREIAEDLIAGIALFFVPRRGGLWLIACDRILQNCPCLVPDIRADTV